MNQNALLETELKRELILKIIDKFINYDQELQRGNLYSINVDFESYSIGNIDILVEGATVKYTL